MEFWLCVSLFTEFQIPQSSDWLVEGGALLVLSHYCTVNGWSRIFIRGSVAEFVVEVSVRGSENTLHI